MVDKKDLKNKAKALAKKVEGKTSELKSQSKQVAKKVVKSAKNVAKDISANYPTKVTAKEAKDKIIKELGDVKPQATKTVARSIPAAKQVAQYLPFASSLYDIGRGGYQAFHGHPYLGTAQVGLGGLGLLADMYTGGKGSTIAKGALKPVINNVGKRLAPTMSKWPTRLGVPVVAEFIYRRDNKQKPKESQPVDNMDVKPSLVPETTAIPRTTSITAGKSNYTNYRQPAYAGPRDSISNLIIKKIANGEGYNQPKEQQPTYQQQHKTIVQSVNNGLQDNDNEDIQPKVQPQGVDYSKALLDAITRQEQYNTQPYLKSLDTYSRQLPWAKSADFFSKMAGAGYAKALDNPYLANLGPIGAEDVATIYPNIAKQRADITNNLLNAQIGRYANTQAATDAGLSPLSGLSDKVMLQQLGALKRAETTADARRYSADKFLQGREEAIQAQRDIAQLRANVQLKMQDASISAKERMQLRQLDNALKVQQMKAQSMYEVAQLGALSRPYSMGVGLTPEYTRTVGYDINYPINPGGGLDPVALQKILGR